MTDLNKNKTVAGVRDMSLEELQAFIDARVRYLVKKEYWVESSSNITEKLLSQDPNPPDLEEEITIAKQEIPEQELIREKEDKDEEAGTSEAGESLEAKEEPKIEWYSLAENTYSLMQLYPFMSQGFWYSLFIFSMQITIVLLTLVDTIDYDANNNPLRIPPMVGVPVSIVQGLTLFILFAWMSDLVQAVVKIQDGFHPDLLKEYPGANYSNWLFSCLAQLSSGLALLTGTFILIMQADTVFTVVLNIKTLIFLALVDDLGFTMAQKGFVTDQLQAETKAVSSAKVPKRNYSRVYRRVLYLLTLVGLYTGFAILKNQQLNGYYLSTHIYVQFGDGWNKKVPYFSGLLQSTGARTIRHRQYLDLGTQSMLLGYCPHEHVWTFSYGDDPCTYFAKSFKTTSYDVTSIPYWEWEVLDSLERPQPFTSFSLVTRDCNPRTCQGLCDEEGLCKCSHDHFGMDCGYSNVCPKLETDKRFQPFQPVALFSDEFESGFQSMPVSDSFQLLRNPSTQNYVSVNRMPVYYSDKSYPASVMFYAGRRWIITSEWGLIDVPEAKRQSPGKWFFPGKTASILEEEFHPFDQHQYTPFYISDPVDFATPDFLDPTPAGLQWWSVKTVDNNTSADGRYEPDVPVPTKLNCILPPATCIGEPQEFCKFGFCNNATGFCQCDYPYYGEQCDLESHCYDQNDRCYGRGVCDESTGSCRCNLPYFGKLCSERYKCYEEGGRCRNGGECDEVTGDCRCPNDPAIKGEACEKQADCFYFGCRNGGFCGENGRCHCQPPFLGQLCDLVDRNQTDLFCSTDEDCTNGTCNVEAGICKCEESGSYGTKCGQKYNCSKVSRWVPSCLNSGTCNEETGICSCPSPYSGPDCSIVPDCTDNSDCGSSENDICDVETGRCVCSSGPSAGKFCEKEKWCMSDDDCHWGVCNQEWEVCTCPWGHTGRKCEFWVNGVYGPHWDELYKNEAVDVLQCGFDDIWGCMLSNHSDTQ